MFKSILVPLDESLFAEWALPTAISIAEASNAKLDLITVEPTTRLFGPGFYTADTDLELERSTDYLRRTAERIAKASGVQVMALARLGPVGPTIAKHAQQTAASLIVVTMHGHGPLRRMWLGSVTDSVVRESEVPVLLVRPAHGAAELSDRPKFRNILVPLDGSTFGEEILPAAIGLGALWRAEFTFMRVVEPRRVTSVPTGPFHLPLGEAALEQKRMGARAYLREVANNFGNPETRIESVVTVDAHAALGILKHTRHANHDLIAMATHGRGGFGRFVLGSVTDKVVRGSGLPVLLYRPREV